MAAKRGPHPPPSSGHADGGWYTLVAADDLKELAVRVGLSDPRDADLGSEAEQISRAFLDFSLFGRATKENSPAGAKKAWCETVEQQAHDLLLTLGHLADTSRPKQNSFLDVITILSAGWPRGPDESRRDANRLFDRARRFAPEVTAKVGTFPKSPTPLNRWLLETAEDQINNTAPNEPTAEPIKSAQATEEALYSFIRNRLPYALDALAIIAKRSADSYAPNVKPKRGSSKDLARHGLFCALAGSYKRMFGVLPSSSNGGRDLDSKRESTPGGKAFHWHRALLTLTAERALAMGRSTAAGAGKVFDNELDPDDLREIVVLCSTAEQSRVGDSLSGWIRKGADLWERAEADRASLRERRAGHLSDR